MGAIWDGTTQCGKAHHGDARLGGCTPTRTIGSPWCCDLSRHPLSSQRVSGQVCGAIGPGYCWGPKNSCRVRRRKGNCSGIPAASASFNPPASAPWPHWAGSGTPGHLSVPSPWHTGVSHLGPHCGILGHRWNPQCWHTVVVAPQGVLTSLAGEQCQWGQSWCAVPQEHGGLELLSRLPASSWGHQCQGVPVCQGAHTPLCAVGW